MLHTPKPIDDLNWQMSMLLFLWENKSCSSGLLGVERSLQSFDSQWLFGTSCFTDTHVRFPYPQLCYGASSYS